MIRMEAKRGIIAALKGKYKVKELCAALGIGRNSYYYEPKTADKDTELTKAIVKIFERNRRAYGQKKLYKAVRREGISVSKERLARVVREEGLVSKYTQRRKPRSVNAVNKDETSDALGRKFNGKRRLEVVVSDLTYVDVNSKWHYICLLVELCHREIIGYSAGAEKSAELVKEAWLSVKDDIREICYFHTDRGSEFKNEEIESILGAGKIERSLSRPGTPIDNAVAESMYDIVKTEFIFGERFKSLSDLKSKLSGWVWWYNNERLHSSIGYKTPVESRESGEVGATDEKMANKACQKFWRKVSVHRQKVLVETNLPGNDAPGHG